MTITSSPTVVCAWCQRMLSRGSTMVSHGICRTCLQTHMPEVYLEMARGRGWEVPAVSAA